MYTNLGNKWDSLQDKECVGAADKPKGNVWASVHAYVRSDPKVLEVFRGLGEGQDWEEEEEEQEIEEYNEPVGAVMGVGEGIPEHTKYIFDSASAGVGEDQTVALK